MKANFINPYKNLPHNKIIDTFLFNFVYIFLITIELIVEYFSIKDYKYFIKPFVLIVLILYFLSLTQQNRTKNERLTEYSLISNLSEIIISFFGEEGIFVMIRYVLLTFSHLFAIMANLSHITNIVKRKNIPFVFLLLFLTYFVDNVGIFDIPKILYISILFLVFSTSNNEDLTSFMDKSYNLRIKGYICFVLSEFLFALERFNKIEQKFLIPLRMILFYLSQYLIVFGCINKRESYLSLNIKKLN